jgi:hypothetical protein
MQEELGAGGEDLYQRLIATSEHDYDYSLSIKRLIHYPPLLISSRHLVQVLSRI